MLYKANIVPGGTKAARSHTAALANDDVIVDSMCRQANVIRAHSFDDLLSYSKVISLPPMRGNRLGIIVFSGGAGVVGADYCFRYGLELPDLPASLSETINSKARVKAVRRGNPLDLGDTLDGELMLYAVESLLRSPEIDGLVLCLSIAKSFEIVVMHAEEAIRKVAELSLETQKPVAIAFSPILHSVDDLRAKVEYPIFSRPEDAVKALAVSHDFWSRQGKPDDFLPTLGVDRVAADTIINSALDAGLRDLGPEALELLQAYGIAVEPLHPATNPEQAISFARTVGYPVVMKINSPQISHKSDVGGVAVGLDNDDDVRGTFERMVTVAKHKRPDADILGVTVQKMVTGGREVIIGSKHDEQFGPVVMFGFGGVMVELFKDVSFRLAPITKRDALEMIDEVKASQLLRGFRDEDPFDHDSVVDALLRLSQLVTDIPQISEVDVNPLAVLPSGQGCRVLDARVFLRMPESKVGKSAK